MNRPRGGDVIVQDDIPIRLQLRVRRSDPEVDRPGITNPLQRPDDVYSLLLGIRRVGGIVYHIEIDPRIEGQDRPNGRPGPFFPAINTNQNYYRLHALPFMAVESIASLLSQAAGLAVVGIIFNNVPALRNWSRPHWISSPMLSNLLCGVP